MRTLTNFEGIERIEPEKCLHEEEFISMDCHARIFCKHCGIYFDIGFKKLHNGLVLPYIKEFNKNGKNKKEDIKKGRRLTFE